MLQIQMIRRRIAAPYLKQQLVIGTLADLLQPLQKPMSIALPLKAPVHEDTVEIKSILRKDLRSKLSVALFHRPRIQDTEGELF